MKILKFGGTSVANASAIKSVSAIIKNKTAQPLTVVVSAMGGVTDELVSCINLAAGKKEYKNKLSEIEAKHRQLIQELVPKANQQILLTYIEKEFGELKRLLGGAYQIGESTPRLRDRILGQGELMSATIISEFLKTEGIDAGFKDSRELIITDNNFGKANVDFRQTTTVSTNFFTGNSTQVIVLPGFIARSDDGEFTTLGRGGSDYTAAIVASVTQAEVLEIWTDVSGMYTANPKLVKQARTIANINYEEAMELSHFGAKVLYAPTIQPVLAKHIPILIKNTFSPDDEGTLITKKKEKNGKSVRGISHIGNIALLSLEGSGMVGVPGISKRFFETLSVLNINVVLITQASSEHSLCIGVSDSDALIAKKALDKVFIHEIEQENLYPIALEKDLAIVALIGETMKSHQGLSGRMFSALGKNNVNIRAIAQGASERNISCVIGSSDVRKALNVLHETFFEENIKQLNLFVMGVGNVGSRFLKQIEQQRLFLREELKLNLRLVGLSNSRTMTFQEEGIPLSDWETTLAKGETANTAQFRERVIQYNLRNSIFVDNTASEAIAKTYTEYLKKSVAVVTCNKIACSSDYPYYQELKGLAKKYNAPFLFETNVGAGLPILDTLKNLIVSGDKIHKIRAVLSGSLNFIFNNFNSETSFHDIVLQAQEEGYTEPDPRIDLSGVDVMRKILILARESGYQLSIDAIENNGFLDRESLQAESNQDFFASLKKKEDTFQKLFANAHQKNCRLKYVAELADGKAKVGLEEIAEGHDFYNLQGSDNIVLFYTDRYAEQPLIIKGAGAGAEVTASGIFADIIRIGNFQS